MNPEVVTLRKAPFHRNSSILFVKLWMQEQQKMNDINHVQPQNKVHLNKPNCSNSNIKVAYDVSKKAVQSFKVLGSL